MLLFLKDNEENLKLWNLFKNLSIKELETVYKVYNLHDNYFYYSN
jgi:hypothetical protein